LRCSGLLIGGLAADDEARRLGHNIKRLDSTGMIL
jgi:hypothetical protein